jgi:hypothetical protein
MTATKWRYRTAWFKYAGEEEQNMAKAKETQAVTTVLAEENGQEKIVSQELIWVGELPPHISEHLNRAMQEVATKLKTPVRIVQFSGRKEVKVFKPDGFVPEVDCEPKFKSTQEMLLAQLAKLPGLSWRDKDEVLKSLSEFGVTRNSVVESLFEAMKGAIILGNEIHFSPSELEAALFKVSYWYVDSTRQVAMKQKLMELLGPKGGL